MAKSVRYRIHKGPRRVAALGQQQPVASLSPERLVPARSGHSQALRLQLQRLAYRPIPAERRRQLIPEKSNNKKTVKLFVSAKYRDDRQNHLGDHRNQIVGSETVEILRSFEQSVSHIDDFSEEEDAEEPSALCVKIALESVIACEICRLGGFIR